MEVRVIPSLNEAPFTNEIHVDGVNVTLKQALETANAATSGRYKISIDADVFEEDLVINSVVPLTIEGNGHVISNCIPVGSNLICEVRPDYLVVDGVLHLVSSSANNPLDINQYVVLNHYGGTPSSSTWPYTVEFDFASNDMADKINLGDSYIFFHSRWLAQTEYITAKTSTTFTTTPISERPYDASPLTHNAYKFMNIVSDTEYYYTSVNSGYLLHIPYSYSSIRYARKPRVLSLESACNVTIQNATIYGSNYIHRKNSQGDRVMYYNAAVYIKYGANIKITGCTFKGCPNGAITTRGNVDGIWIENCDFLDLYCKGIHIGASTNQPTSDTEDELLVHSLASDNTTHNVRIKDCCFKRCGLLKADGSPIYIQNAANVYVCRNTILNCSYSAIQVGWSYSHIEQTDTCHDIYIANNHIGYVGNHLLSDLGGIYTIGQCRNGYMIGNLIHDVYSMSGNLGIACYNDQGSKYWFWYGNVICGCDAFFQNNFNYCCGFENNVFMYSNKAGILLNNSLGVYWYNCVFKTNKDISDNKSIQMDMCIFDSEPVVGGKPLNCRYIIANPINTLFRDVLNHDFSIDTSKSYSIDYNNLSHVLAYDSQNSFLNVRYWNYTKGVSTNRSQRDTISESFVYDGQTYDISKYSRFLCTTSLHNFDNDYINAAIQE